MLKLYPALILAALLLFSCSNSDDKDSVYTCGGAEYAPPYQKCEGGIVKIQCGNNYYNPAMQFCSEQDNLVYDKCEGKDYNTEEHTCENAKLYDFCGTSKMDPETQFCYFVDNLVYDKCGGKEYYPSSLSEICEDDILKFSCGKGGFYNPETQFCNNVIIFDKCGSAEYNPLYQQCKDNVILFECEDKWYDPSKEQCIRRTFKIEPFVDGRDNITYKSVQIGTQVWMAENLNYEAEGSVCYEDEEFNCATYGRLYTWIMALEICPMGWHLPSTDELDVLIDYVGGNNVAGVYLKATNGWREGSNGLDKYGFAALPGGYVSEDGFLYIGLIGSWWSSTSNSSQSAYYMSMNYGEGAVKNYRYSPSGGSSWSWMNHNKMGMFSIRCIKD